MKTEQPYCVRLLLPGEAVKSSTIFTGKHLCWKSFFKKVAGLLQNTSGGCLCHWVKSVRIRSYSVPHFPECGKIRNRITPNTDAFYAVCTSDSLEFQEEILVIIKKLSKCNVLVYFFIFVCLFVGWFAFLL